MKMEDRLNMIKNKNFVPVEGVVDALVVAVAVELEVVAEAVDAKNGKKFKKNLGIL